MDKEVPHIPLKHERFHAIFHVIFGKIYGSCRLRLFKFTSNYYGLTQKYKKKLIKTHSETKNLCLKLRNIREPSYSSQLDFKAHVETFLPFFLHVKAQMITKNRCQQEKLLKLVKINENIRLKKEQQQNFSKSLLADL